MDEYIGAIKMFAGSYAPPNWMMCQGQLLTIKEYDDLFAVLGNAFGGDGVTTFALPDFRGRGPIGANSQVTTVPQVAVGATGGAEAVQMNSATMPLHTHTVEGTVQMAVSDLPADTDSPIGTYFAQTGINMFQGAPGDQDGGNVYYQFSVDSAGTAAPVPVPVLSPYQVVNYIIYVSNPDTSSDTSTDGGNGG